MAQGSGLLHTARATRAVAAPQRPGACGRLGAGHTPGSGPPRCVGMVGVATGSYSSAQLAELAGPAGEGKWEPVILEEGIADPGFLAACGVV